MSVKSKMGALADAIRIGTEKSSKMRIEDMILNIPLIKSFRTSVTPALFDRSIKSFDIPIEVVKIGNGAFSYCNHLTSVTIPQGVTTIGNYAFYFCRKLVSINLPEGVTTIGDHTFSGCSSLVSIDLPDGITSIGDIAFGDCSSLTDIYCNFAEGAVDGAPWGAPQNVNIHYNT